MLIDNRCMGCMSILEDGLPECPVCGCKADYENEENFLPVKTEFEDRYVIGKMISYSGATVTYIGFDKIEKNPVYIYEFFPVKVSVRGEKGKVEPSDPSSVSFELLEKEFRQTVRAVARLRDLSFMLPVYDIFETNGTIYAVSEYMPLTTLNDYLKQKGGKLSWEETRKLFIPFLSSLSACHSAGLFHFGICPQNIIVGSNNKLHLIGFDISATHTMSTPLKADIAEYYGAPEQYDFDGELSPATDVYSVTAVIFRCLTGNTPPNGAHRNPKGEDLLLSAEIAEQLPEHVTEALSNGLQPRPRKRIETIEELRDKLSTGDIVTSLAEETKVIGIAGAVREIDEDEEKRKKERNKYAMVLAGSIVAFILFVMVIVLIIVFNDDEKKEVDNNSNASATISTTVITTTTAAESKEELTKVPDITAAQISYYDLTESGGYRVYNNLPVELAGYQFSSSEKGTICGQDPLPGKTIKPGQTVKVYISAGEQMTTVPDVTGWDADHAKLYLEALGFRVDLDEANDPDAEFNSVVGTWPSAGNTPDSDNRITLRVNKTMPTEAPVSVETASETESINTESSVPEA